MILSGQTLKSKYSDIVTPFIDHKEIAHGMSYGLSLAGYDIRIKESVRLWRGDFILASSIEEFNMPNNVVGFVHDKSSWARKGLSLYNTIIEPGWKGYLTLEMVNHEWYGKGEPLEDSFKEHGLFIPAGSPIAQVIFMYTDDDTEGYSGKYQNAPEGPQEAIYERAS